MATSILRRPSVRSSIDNPPFVPSPQWLSESPARPPSNRSSTTPRTPYIDHPGALNAPASQPDPRSALRSPVPPPPANLYQGQTAAFNVDPGIPFLATAGPSDDGSSTASRSLRAMDEEWPSPKEKKLTRGIVSGLKRAVGSLRQSRGSRRTVDDDTYVYMQPQQFRDSGYANSTHGQALPHPPGVALYDPQQLPPQLPNGALPPTYAAPAQPPPQPQATYSPTSPLQRPPSQINTPFQLISPPSTLVSPISADPDYGSDYALMDPPTPPPSDTPLTIYLARAHRLIAHIAALPWVAPERVTVDYYPERVKRRDDPKHAPQIGWTAQDYTRPSFRTPGIFGAHADSEGGTWDEWEEEYDKGYKDLEARPVVAPLITPRRSAYDEIDLGEEFGEARNTPMPTPKGTPRYAGGDVSLYGGYTPQSLMPTPSLYARPITPAALTPGVALTPLPQDPPEPTRPPRPSTPAIGLANPSTLASASASAPQQLQPQPQPQVVYASAPSPTRTPTRSRPPSQVSSHGTSMYTYREYSPAAGAGPGGSPVSSRSRSHHSMSDSSVRLTVPPRGPGLGPPSVHSRGVSRPKSVTMNNARQSVGAGGGGGGYGTYVSPQPQPQPQPHPPIQGVPVVPRGSVRSGRSGSVREWSG